MNASVRGRRTPAFSSPLPLNDHRRDLGKSTRSIACRTEGLVPAAMARAVCGRHRTPVGVPDLRRADGSHADRAQARRRLFLPADQRRDHSTSGRHHRPRGLEGGAGPAARLHVQIVSLFSVIAVLPAVLVAIVANVTIDRGLDRLFSGPTKEVIQNSLIVANAYLHEHAQLIRGDILGMANDVSHARPRYDLDRSSFRQLLTASAASRNLPGAMLIDKEPKILETAQTGIQQDFQTPAPEFLSGVDENEPQIAVFIEANYVAAVIRLRNFSDTFLYVARLLDPRVVAQLRQTQASVAEYAALESRKLGIQVAFALMFAVIALTILMASVLIGLNFANRLVAPLRRLMNAANIVSTGDLHVQVPVLRSEGDLAQLGETFNKMTQELRTQRDELVSASDLIDSRRRFIEAVLSSASAGIIGVDASGSVGILNRSAEKLIGHAESETLGHPLSDVLPELDDMMKTAREGTQRL